ncbi:SAF domain-containing protein [Zafaria sp. Z1313]|uniref:SAF domain-containing protein n=1 Tax=unclassified Zafaria TaxID=2828765 RepID=UPI002E7AA9F3|nr:SAF domain-containing protein [Zafaria sp. J156]MEE1620306.1 SAF domain-containing protein [Zafaria sp. J156]
MSSAGKAENEARRLRRPGWRDPRLLVGILLIAASVAGVVALVSSLDRTAPVFVAKEDISLGEKIDPSRLTVADVRLDGLEDGYLPAGDALDGLQATELIRAGELVARGAVGRHDPGNRKPVTIEVAQSLPQAVVAGSRVDIWASTRDRAANAYAEPELVLPATEVAAIRPLESGFGASDGVVLEVLVEDSRLGGLLGVLANDARVTVVFNPTGEEP